MSTDKYDGLAWEITLGVAGGILLASFVSAIIGSIGIWLFMSGVRIELPVKAAAPAVYSQHTSYSTTPITVPAKSVEECKELTNGILNEQFRRCRTTHQEMNPAAQ